MQTYVGYINFIADLPQLLHTSSRESSVVGTSVMDILEYQDDKDNSMVFVAQGREIIIEVGALRTPCMVNLETWVFLPRLADYMENS
jgi:hypothetical protein